MIGPAVVAATVAGAGATAAAGSRRWMTEARRAAVRRAEHAPGIASDLTAIGSDVDAFVSAAAGRFAAGGGTGVVVAVVMWSVVGPFSLVAVALGTGIGAMSARWTLARDAARARAELKAGALELAELASLGIGGGLGVAAALERGLAALAGPGARRLRAIAGPGPEPWRALESFGEAVAVVELADLGATLGVGVHQQARTRDVLLGWAEAARAARLEEAEASAAATTEAMTGPLALVAFGFLLVVGVPAVVQLLSGVSGVHL